jgi:hypothetical protein
MLGALRKKMEVLVLALPSGSYAQRVQAEYLKELESRAQAAFQTPRAPQGPDTPSFGLPGAGQAA